MSRLESSETIEATVGINRHPVHHFGRAVSAEQRVYVLHSVACRSNELRDLRECEYSLALDLGIEPEQWRGSEDQTVGLIIDPNTGKLRPTDATALAAEQMRFPRRCKWCQMVHDAATVTVVDRYLDCSTYRCPGCQVLLDDRPESWGGSSLPVEVSRG